MLTLCSGVGLVHAADDNVPYPQIRVVGEGTATLAADLALVGLTVTREADTAGEALAANSAAMQEVLLAMREEGIAERDLQTAQFSIQPRYQHSPRTPSGEQEPPQIVGYSVSNSLSVRVRNISRVGAILDRSVALGVNEGGNIVFGNDDPSAALAQARAAAVTDALTRAKTLTAAAGVKVGRILEISEQSSQPRPMPMARAEMMMSAADAVPIASGENSYQVRVNIILAIEQ
ncbi:MAG TPA: SIMPL domain-containing protein [Kineobactrum sp.]